jgi:hypothetical protein
MFFLLYDIHPRNWNVYNSKVGNNMGYIAMVLYFPFLVILYYQRKHKLPYCPRYIAKGLTVEKKLSERSPTKHALLYQLTTKNWGLHRQLSRERPHCTLVEEPHNRIA